MSLPTPTTCANPRCHDTSIKPIHHSTQSIAIDAVDGPPVFAHHVTYRCQQCGHTWAVQGYTSQADIGISSGLRAADAPSSTLSRGW